MTCSRPLGSVAVAWLVVAVFGSRRVADDQTLWRAAEAGHWQPSARWLAAYTVVLLALLAGHSASASSEKDPLEAINRPIFAFNDALDRVAVPVLLVVGEEDAKFRGIAVFG